MKKEFPTLPDFIEIEQSLSVTSNPFEEIDNQGFMFGLQSVKGEDAHYAGLFSELQKLSQRLFVITDKAEKMKPNLQKKLDEMAAQRSAVWKNDEFLESLDDEIAKLEETLLYQPKNPDRADEIISQATQLLIKGKNFKRAKVEATSQKIWQSYKDNEKNYLELLDDFKRACQDVQGGNSASAEMIRLSREVLSNSDQNSANPSKFQHFKAENVIADPVRAEVSRQSVSTQNVSTAEQKNQTLELDEILSFDEGMSEVAPYNKVTLEDFIREIEQGEPQSSERKKANSQPKKSSTENQRAQAGNSSLGTFNSFQRDLLLTSIPKQNLRSHSNSRTKRRAQK